MKRPTGIFKLRNEYVSAQPSYEDTPKAVIAAVAYSFALRLSNGDHAAALRLIADEWRILNENGIVPQKALAAITRPPAAEEKS